MQSWIVIRRFKSFCFSTNF